VNWLVQTATVVRYSE